MKRQKDNYQVQWCIRTHIPCHPLPPIKKYALGPELIDDQVGIFCMYTAVLTSASVKLVNGIDTWMIDNR